MARQKEFYSLYTALQIEDTLTKSRTQPFVIVKDEEEKCKRVFLTLEDADTWFQARTDGLMTPEIEALEFAGESIPGEDLFELRVNVLKPDQYGLQGSTGNKLEFTFATVDKSTQATTGESVDMYFTIGSILKSKVYTYEQGKTYQFELDDYLQLGVNTISILVRGRTSGLSRVVNAKFTLLNFELSTTFNIAKSLNPTDSLSITYNCKGNYARSVYFYIDGELKAKEDISSLETNPTKVKIFPNFGTTYGSGTHTLLMKAVMTIDQDTSFGSKLLYREFEVTGVNHTTTLVSADFPSTYNAFQGNVPGFTGTQYVTQSLTWAFYSATLPTANVVWRLFNLTTGIETPIGSRQADVVQGETDVMPEPVKFMPTESGIFKLQALVEGTVLEKDYQISIAKNELITEAKDGMMLRLTAIGRSNEEEATARKDWSCTFNGIHSYVQFSTGFPFTAAAGYNNDGVEFYNGYTGILKGYKPFAKGNATVAANGVCFGMRFRTYNMDKEDALVAWIGDPQQGPGIFIYPNKAILRSSAGSSRDIILRFKDEEDTDIYWIIYPNENSEMALFSFLQVNGVRCFPRSYDIAENFTIGDKDEDSDLGLLHLGDPNGKCGIRVYSIRAYNIYQSEKQLCNNYIIDSGDITSAIQDNDIYVDGGGILDVDIAKLEERMPMVKLTGDISQMAGSKGKPELDNIGVILTHPDYYDQYAECTAAYLKKSGQSTQDRIGPPSIHVKFNKDKKNILKDRNGKQWPKNRLPILPGYVPENSLRLLNNILESSNCHTGGALTFINKIARDTQIDGKYPLRTPALDYVLSGQYSQDMVTAHSGNTADYVFPYELNFTATGYPGVVVWRKDANSAYQWLGMYTFIQEKKSFYANGGHTIYDKITSDGTLDPFDIYSGKKGNKLLDNDGFLRFEIVTKSIWSMFQKGGELTYDNNIGNGAVDGKVQDAIEKISEHDEETPEQCLADWQEFGDEVIKPMCATEGNLTAFDNIVWNIFDIDNICAYYIWMLTVCNTDGSFRNINLVRYQKNMKWRFVPWDWDMTLGLLQDTYQLDAQPCSDLYTKVNDTYIYNGMGNRTPGATGLDSFWFWDACLKNQAFKTRLPKIFSAMYSAGMTKQGWINAFDSFTTKFSSALYNTDAQGKYVLTFFTYGENYLVSDQGDRTAHRHWFLDTNVDYLEQLNGVGDFVNIRTSTRAADADNAKIYLTAGASAYFGWTISGQTTASDKTDGEDLESSTRTDRISMGEDFTMTINRILTSKDILGILSPQKLEKIDMHEFARFFSADLNFTACYNANTKISFMKKLILGMTTQDIKTYGPNTRSVNTIDGVTNMSRLEEFNIQGLAGLRANPIITGCNNLKKYYAAASGLTAFNPAEGCVFTEVQLNDKLTSIKATDVTLPTDGIKFYTLTSSNDLQTISCPTTLVSLNLVGMGSDEGTHKLLHNWLMMLKNNPSVLPNAQLVCRNLNWSNATKEDVMMLATVKTGALSCYLTGYVYCPTETYDQGELITLLNAFGNNVFDYSCISTNLVCDCAGDGISISASGTGVTSDNGVISVVQGYPVLLVGAGFPISGSSKSNYRWRIKINNEWLTGTDLIPIISFGSCTLNWKTGEMTTTECSDSEVTYEINCYDNLNFVNGSALTTVKVRLYPNTVSTSLISSLVPTDVVDGEILITAVGAYLFEAENKRMMSGLSVTFDGTMTQIDGGVWTLENEDSRYTTRYNAGESNPFIQYCLNVTALPTDDLKITLKYKSNWKNGSLLTANDIKLAIVSVVPQLLINDVIVGNVPLFNAIEAANVTHSNAAYYSSMELKKLVGEMNLATLLGESVASLVSLYSNGYYVMLYLKNVTVFNFDGCTGLDGITLDATKLNWVLKINTQHTKMNVKTNANNQALVELKLGTPSKIEINNCNILNINNSAHTKTVSLSCSEIDEIAHDVCGVKLSATDTTASSDGRLGDVDVITVTDYVYVDSKKRLGNKAGCTFNVTQNNTRIRILDATVKSLLLGISGLDADGDGIITLPEAQAVTALTVFGSSAENTDGATIKTFDELQYFTNVEVKDCMFRNCKQLTSIALPENDDAIKINSLFYGCSALTNVDVSKFDSSNVTNTSSMFKNCTALKTLDLSSLNLDNSTNIGDMFYGCTALEELKVGAWNFSGVKSLASVFRNCSKLKSLDLTNWNVSNVTNFQWTFNGCAALESLTLTGWTTTSATNLNSMFANCKALKTLNISMFDTSKVTNFGNMFSGCNALTTINLSNFDTTSMSADTNYGGFGSDFFNGCTNITSVTASAKLFNCAIRESNPHTNMQLFRHLSGWVNATQITSLLGYLPDLTTFDDGRTGTLKLSANTYAKVTSAQITAASNKGWTITK